MHLIPICHFGQGAGGPNKWFANGQADVDTYIGTPLGTLVTAAEILRPGDFAAGNLVGMIAGWTGVPANGPSYKVPFTGAADDPLGVSFGDGTTQKFDFGVGPWNPGASDFVHLMTYKLMSSTNNRFICGDYSSGVHGSASYINSGKIYGPVSGPGSTMWANISYGSLSTPHFIVRWLYSNRSGLYGDTGNNMPIGSDPGDITSTNSWVMGASPLYTAANCVQGPSVYFVGAQAAPFFDATGLTAAAKVVFDNWWAS